VGVGPGPRGRRQREAREVRGGNETEEEGGYKGGEGIGKGKGEREGKEHCLAVATPLVVCVHVFSTVVHFCRLRNVT